MLLLKTLNFFIDASRHSGGSDGFDNSEDRRLGATSAFPTSTLQSSAWEGWWHDADHARQADA
ncbi:hypothetical protein ACIQC5_19410 [Paenarthrobacter sp. NPDC092416]|uniref:hypothetical protein n=1 Tax=Paenarthrobacter sp. NPDC092416 TaxID=3364386 RepID=UPI0037FF620C